MTPVVQAVAAAPGIKVRVFVIVQHVLDRVLTLFGIYPWHSLGSREAGAGSERCHRAHPCGTAISTGQRKPPICYWYMAKPPPLHRQEPDARRRSHLR